MLDPCYAHLKKHRKTVKKNDYFYWIFSIVVTYEIRVFFEGAQKEIFSSILKFENVNT